jgi:hypothetical protein
MIRIGEETGRMEEMLKRLSEIYDKKLEVGITKLMGMVEPMFTLIIGGFVGSVIIAMVIIITRKGSNMKDLVFNIKDNEIEIFYVKKLLNRVTINKKVLFSLYNQDKISQADFKLNTQGNIINLKNILEENGIKDKKAKLILSMDGIITREVNIPLIKNKNLKKFIKYNIKEYFTINIEDYYFDYKITSRLYDDKDTYKLLLVAIPKENSSHSYMLLNNGRFIWKRLEDGSEYMDYLI